MENSGRHQRNAIIRLIENSDIFCKVTHNAFSSDSKQD